MLIVAYLCVFFQHNLHKRNIRTILQSQTKYFIFLGLNTEHTFKVIESTFAVKCGSLISYQYASALPRLLSRGIFIIFISHIIFVTLTNSLLMQNARKTIEQLNQQLDKAQIIARLKQINLKGGVGCPPPGKYCPPPGLYCPPPGK